MVLIAIAAIVAIAVIAIAATAIVGAVVVAIAAAAVAIVVPCAGLKIILNYIFIYFYILSEYLHYYILI